MAAALAVYAAVLALGLATPVLAAMGVLGRLAEGEDSPLRQTAHVGPGRAVDAGRPDTAPPGASGAPCPYLPPPRPSWAVDLPAKAGERPQASPTD